VSVARECSKAISSLLRHEHIRGETANRLEEQLARFKLWASNIGVFAARRWSLDYRLRDSPDIIELVVELLRAVIVRTSYGTIGCMAPQVLAAS
jgi:hypothetical protein